MGEFQRRDSDISLDFIQEVLADSDPDVNVQTVEVSEASGRGDNYTSMVYRVRAIGSKGAEPWSKSFVHKCIPLSRARREAFKSDSLFLNEVAFYTKALPALLKFQASRGFEVFKEVPKVYLAKSNVLVLEDLKERKFVMTDRKQFLDAEHCLAVIRYAHINPLETRCKPLHPCILVGSCNDQPLMRKIVFRALARFHALSLAMKTLQPEAFKSEVVDSVTECLFKQDNEEWYQEYYRQATQNAVNFVKESLVTREEREKYLKKFENFVDSSFFRRMVSMVQPKEPVSVICHGDCWTNNVLFKYSESGVISKLCFLDFQLVRYSSPALDLVNFLYICTSRLLRSSHMDLFIKSYCETVKKALVDLGCPNGPFGDEDLTEIIKQEIHNCGKFGLGLAVDMIPISTCDSDQAPDLYVDENINRSESEKPVWTKNEVCRRRMTDLVQELIDKGDL